MEFRLKWSIFSIYFKWSRLLGTFIFLYAASCKKRCLKHELEPRECFRSFPFFLYWSIVTERLVLLEGEQPTLVFATTYLTLFIGLEAERCWILLENGGGRCLAVKCFFFFFFGVGFFLFSFSRACVCEWYYC